MLNRTNGRLAALLAMLGAAAGAAMPLPALENAPSANYGGYVPTGRTRIAGPRRPAGSKLARMAEQRRIGGTGGSSKRGAYGNWSRTLREQARINNRAARLLGMTG